MFDKEIRQYGVEHYYAGREKIQAEWYIKIDKPYVRKVELFEDGKHGGFAISQETLHYSSWAFEGFSSLRRNKKGPVLYKAENKNQ